MATREARTLRQPRRRPGRRSIEAGRREILDAAVAFLGERPFRALTVGRLMERAGIGRSAFYFYFRDVYQVAEALLREVQQEIIDAAMPWIEGRGKPADNLREMLARGSAIWARRGPMLRGISDAAPLDARLEGVFREIVGRLDQAIAAVIRREQAADRMGALDPDETGIALNQLNLAYLNDRLGRSPQADPARVAETLERIWIRTLYHGRDDDAPIPRTPGKETAA